MTELNHFGEYVRNGAGRNWSMAEWARRLGVSRAFMTLLCQGKRKPGLDTAVRIEQLTEGAISAKSWSETPEPPGVSPGGGHGSDCDPGVFGAYSEA